jgi:hypothetical protein
MPELNKEKPKKNLSKVCFLITPIGQEGSPTRARVDQWIELIYKKALGSDYEIVRADRISTPGIITEQIIQHIIDADLVIIDYTELNQNVMYEAAIRHLSDKPYIQIHESGVRFPFDIHNLRSIPYNSADLCYPDKLIEGIKNSLEEINDPKYEQPQIVKQKFDFNKILTDPEKFVRLLKEHIIVPKDSESLKLSGEESIVTISDAYDFASTGLGRKKIVCPKCKTIKYESLYGTPFISGLGLGGSAMVYEGAYLNGHHYKCNTCGTEFE